MSGKRYKQKKKKNLMNFLIFYTIICIFFIASYTLSRYVDKATGSAGISIAQIKVTVNEINVNEDKPFILNFSEASTFMSQKIAPNGSGYFEIVIDPTGTEVSLEYEFMFNLANLDKDFKLLYFTVNDGENHYDITDGNIVKNEILLSNDEIGFTDTEITNIKVYWSWNEKNDFENPDIDDFNNKNIEVFATVKQKIKET